MKKIILFLFAAAMILSCSTSEETPDISLSVETLTFDGEASSQTLSLTSNVSWTATNDCDWFTATPVSGTGSGREKEIKVTVLKNEGLTRSGSVTYSIGSKEVKLAVVQAGIPAISVSKDEFLFGSDAADSSVFIVSNYDWKASSDASWLTVSPASGSASLEAQTVTIAVSDNDDAERTGTITFSNGSEEVFVKVTQQEPTVLTLSAEALEFESSPSTLPVEVSSGKDWTAASNAEWISVSPASGAGSRTAQSVAVTVLENDSDEARTGSVTFVSGALTAVLEISQKAYSLVYGGVTYKTAVLKDGKRWMCENLRFIPDGFTPSSSLTDVTAGVFYPVKLNAAHTAAEFATDEASVKASGYFYQGEVALGLKVGGLTSVEQAKALEGAQGICPPGWRVPTAADITALVGKGVGLTLNENAPYYDKTLANGSIDLLNADGFNVGAYGAVTIQDNTKTTGALMGYLKTCPDYIASGFMWGSTYASVTYNTAGDAASGVKNLQFRGFMPMKNNGTFNGSNISYRIAAPLRCVKN